MPRLALALLPCFLCALGMNCFGVDSKPADPIVNGSPLSYWLRNFDIRSSKRDVPAVEGAITKLGTNAIPFLVYEMKSGERAQKTNLSADQISDAMYRSTWAAQGLAYLGDRAAYVIPELIAYMTNGDSGTVRVTGDVLTIFGEKGVRAIVAGLANPVEDSRLEAAGVLRTLTTNIAPIVPDIFANMDHLGEISASQCANAIVKSGLSSSVIAKGFIDKLSSTNADCRMVSTWYLERLGTNAIEAVPQLQRLLSDTNENVRSGAEDALQAINTEKARQ